MTAPVALGSRRELFVDRFLVDRLEGAALHLHPPVRKEVVFQISQPWESACTACYNLVQEGDRVLLYYRGFYPIGQDYADGAASQTTNLAVSRDGIRFEQPDLGLVEFEGTRRNNVLIQGHESHNFCVFLDANPAADPEQRFKAVGGTGRSNLHGFASPDGLRWTPVKEGPLEVTGAFDSLNVPLWDPHVGRYRLFSRYSETKGGRVRAIQSCTSEDFVHWTDPEPHRYGDGVPLEHFYTNATTPCPGAEQILLSFPMRFLPERELDTAGMPYPGSGLSDAVFMSQPRRRPLGPHLPGGLAAARHRPAQLVPPQLHPRPRPGADGRRRVVDLHLGALRVVDEPPAPRGRAAPRVRLGAGRVRRGRARDAAPAARRRRPAPELRHLGGRIAAGGDPGRVGTSAAGVRPGGDGPGIRRPARRPGGLEGGGRSLRPEGAPGAPAGGAAGRRSVRSAERLSAAGPRSAWRATAGLIQVEEVPRLHAAGVVLAHQADPRHHISPTQSMEPIRRRTNLDIRRRLSHRRSVVESCLRFIGESSKRRVGVGWRPGGPGAD